MAQTEFTKAVATPLKLESELTTLASIPIVGLSVYDDGAGGAVVIHANALDNDQQQEVAELLAAHVADAPLQNYLELIASTDGISTPYIQARGPGANVNAAIKTKGNNAGFFIQAAIHELKRADGITGVSASFGPDANNLIYDGGDATVLDPVVAFDLASSAGSKASFDFIPKGAGEFRVAGVKVATVADAYTDEKAQDAVGAMVDATLVYVDATPLLRRAALTGPITAAAGSNATVVAAQTGTGTTFVMQTAPAITNPTINDSNGNEAILVETTASAVNEVTIKNAATGTDPTIKPTGTDINIGLKIMPKGSGIATIGNAGDSTLGDGTLRVVHPQTTKKIDLGKPANEFNDVYATRLFTGQNQVGYSLTSYAAGTAYALTATPAQLNFGTTDPSITLDKAGTYLITGRCAMKYNAATFAANRTTTIKLRRTNNTAADLTNGTVTATTRIITAITDAFVDQTWSVIYTTTNADDIVQLFGSIDVVPTAGSLDAFEASIVAVRLL